MGKNRDTLPSPHDQDDRSFVIFLGVSAAIAATACAGVFGLVKITNNPRSDLPTCEQPSEWYKVSDDELAEARQVFEEGGYDSQSQSLTWHYAHYGEVACSPALDGAVVAQEGAVVQLTERFLGDTKVYPQRNICAVVGMLENGTAQVVCPNPPPETGQ